MRGNEMKIKRAANEFSTAREAQSSTYTPLSKHAPYEWHLIPYGALLIVDTENIVQASFRHLESFANWRAEMVIPGTLEC